MEKITMEEKERVLALAREKLQRQRSDIQEQLAALMASSVEEGKSSAGDKYETQREMIKQSRDILEVQLSRIQSMIHQLEAISVQACERVQEGALVKLPLGLIWVGISLGKVVDKEKEYQCISKDAPLFVAIKGLKAQERAMFRGKELIVEQVV